MPSSSSNTDAENSTARKARHKSKVKHRETGSTGLDPQRQSQSQNDRQTQTQVQYPIQPEVQNRTQTSNPNEPRNAIASSSKSHTSNHDDGRSFNALTLTTATFALNEDYIAFDFSDDEDEDDEEVEEGHESPPHSPSRSRGEGKGKQKEVTDGERNRGRDKDSERGGYNSKKRTLAQMELEEDEYANKKQRMVAASRLTPWVEDVEWDRCRNLAEMLHREVKAFVDYVSPTAIEHEVRGMVITMITQVIQRAWPDARVSAFGSYQTKLYLPLGDIDLVIQSRTMDNYDKRRILFTLAQVLRKANITENVQVIAKAKVPIVKFVTIHGRFAVDISLNLDNGIRAGQVVNRFLKELPALQSLVMVIKHFLSQRSMNEVYSGGLGSYAIVCMAVSFLQMHPKIRAGEIDPSQNLGVLVMEFFELYGHYFNYENAGISLRHGGTYFNKSVRGWFDIRNSGLLSIEDPIDIANDVSKSSYNMPRVRKTLAGAHEVLAAAALMRARVLSSKARGEYTDLRGSSRLREHDHQSILGSVMGVTQETLNHRKMVKQLYEQGTLHNLLGLPRYRPPDPAAQKLPREITPGAIVTSGRRAVEVAWGEAEMDLGLSNMNEEVALARSRSPDEESRYSTRHPRKRRRVSPNGHAAAVFVEASEEEERYIPPVINSRKKTRSSSEEEAGQLNEWPKPSNEARRAYWASKGLPGGGLRDSD